MLNNMGTGLHHSILIGCLIFAVALIYSSVGHGGASGYLAVLTFFHFAPVPMATSALVLNLIVAGLAWYSFAHARHFSLRLILPFLAASLPMAFLGGALKIPPHVYGVLLSISLAIAAARLMMPNGHSEKADDAAEPAWWISAPLGGLIGLLSGMVGVGGGIFLSPILLLMGWAGPKRTAAVSAFFIWVNSLAGLLGRGISSQLDLTLVAPFVIPALLGGAAGSRLGATRISGLALRRLLGLVLLIAAWKAMRPGMTGP